MGEVGDCAERCVIEVEMVSGARASSETSVVEGVCRERRRRGHRRSTVAECVTPAAYLPPYNSS